MPFRIVLIVFVLLHSLLFPQLNALDIPKKYDVIIVGAGISGLAAAYELKKNPDIDVLVLEAGDRIGGRIWTVNPWGAKLELGASWIHGIENNPILDVVVDMGQIVQPTVYNDKCVTRKLKSTTIYDFDGNKLSQERMKLLKTLCEEFVTFLNLEAEIKAPPEHSLMDAFQHFVTQKEIKGELYHQFYQLNRILHSNEYAADFQDLSILEHDPSLMEEEEEGSNAILPYGYDLVTLKLSKNIPIELNTQVTAVTYSNQGVIFQTNKGNFEADYGIVTVPLGVLKAKAIEFIPPLPKERQSAIDLLQMGLFNKIFLCFSFPFWDNTEWITIIPPENSHAMFDFMNLDRVSKRPILLSFVSGQFAQDLENKSDNEIVDLMMDSLKKAYGDNIPKPCSALITRWGKNPLFNGSYSYFPAVQPEGLPHQVMDPPLQERLFFGGEAFSMHENSTVFGAFMRGQQIAQRILELAGQTRVLPH